MPAKCITFKLIFINIKYFPVASAAFIVQICYTWYASSQLSQFDYVSPTFASVEFYQRCSLSLYVTLSLCVACKHFKIIITSEKFTLTRRDAVCILKAVKENDNRVKVAAADTSASTTVTPSGIIHCH